MLSVAEIQRAVFQTERRGEERKDNMASGMSEQVYRLLLKKGFDEGLSREIAFTHMNTDYTATRMLGYLYRLSNPTEEMVVDEMLAILEDRERFRKKHESEEAQAAITRFYNER